VNLTDYEESLRSTVRLARLSFSSAASSVFLYNEERDVLVFEAASGVGEDTIVGMELPAHHGIAGWVASTGEPILVRDVSEDSRFDLDTAAETGYVPEVIMAIPLIQKGEIIGVMEVLDPKLESMNDITALDMLSELATQAATVLSLVPRSRSRADALRAEAAVRFDALLEAIPERRLDGLGRLLDAISAIVG
jgi:signal transduction protein with GAF and PtsI domain